MSWLRLTLECHATHVDSLSHLFEQFEAVAISSEAVTEEQLFAGISEDPVYWKRTAVSALFDDCVDLDILHACARNRIGTENLLNSRIESVADKNWVDAQKEQHGAMIFADRLCIKPGWLEVETDYPVTLELDPGLAFGTGKHATTSLCLEWLASHDLKQQNIIDYGCGSGILALAAAKLGAKLVYAVDIDPQAIIATNANASKNDLTENIVVSTADSIVMPQADTLIANILLNSLIELAPHLSELVKPSGKLALSGILAVQIDECLAAYTPWFTMSEPVFQDEWVLLEGQRLT
jgi:ribosomal protein L11 methyltransferase